MITWNNQLALSLLASMTQDSVYEHYTNYRSRNPSFHPPAAESCLLLYEFCCRSGTPPLCLFHTPIQGPSSQYNQNLCVNTAYSIRITLNLNAQVAPLKRALFIQQIVIYSKYSSFIPGFLSFIIRVVYALGQYSKT